MKKRSLYGLILIVIALSVMLLGLFDFKRNPECYSVNRTWSNIEGKYVEGDMLEAINRNSTTEKLPECYVLRSKIFEITRGILIVAIIFLGANTLWVSIPTKKKKELIKEFSKK